MKEKICTKCGDPKSFSEFGKQKNGKDGLRYECKDCSNKRTKDYHHTKEGLISNIYSSQKQSSKRRNHPPPTYTNKELLEFALKSNDFNDLYDTWKASGYKRALSPSSDRADDYLPYSFENFNKWMPWQENKQKGHDDRRNGINNKNSKAVIGTHIITGEVIEFVSAREAARQTRINQGHISQCCNGKLKSAGGYTWVFKN